MEWASFDYARAKRIPEVIIRAELLENRLKKTEGNVLEVGVGSGDVTSVLIKKFKKVVCVDSDKKNFENLKRLEERDLDRIDFIHSKIEYANLTNSKYDNIVLFGILEHLKNPVKVLKKLSKSLSEDGTMHIVVNLANSIHRLLGMKMGMMSHTTKLTDSDIKLGHYRIYTLPLLKHHIKKSGLEKVFEQPFYLKPLPTKILTPLPMEIHRGLDLLGREYPELASYTYLEVKKLKN